MPTSPLSFLFSAAMVLTPFGPGQQARLAAWLNWGAAYRDCYAPVPFGLRIDQAFTAHCIEETLRRWRGDSPEQQAATDALIAATPHLIATLNAPAAESENGEENPGGKRPRLDPPAPSADR
jgi:hypothetical protein